MTVPKTNRTWREVERMRLTEEVVAVVYQAGRLRAIVSQDGPDGYWHLSISRKDGLYPNWDEVADARYDLLPHDIDCGLILPPPADYVNFHPGVLQITEIRDAAMPIDRGGGAPRTRETLLGTFGAESWVG